MNIFNKLISISFFKSSVNISGKSLVTLDFRVTLAFLSSTLVVVSVEAILLSASIAKSLFASNLPNLVLANIDSPKPSTPTIDPSALLLSGLKFKSLSATLSIILSPSALLSCLDLI